MNNRIYIAGKITGDPNYREKFKAGAYECETAQFSTRITPLQYAQRKNRIMCFKPVNPTEFTLIGIPLTEYRWHIGMSVCLFKLLFCSFVYMLKGWTDSRGATIEHGTAKFLHKRIVYQDPHEAPKPKTKKNLVFCREKAKKFLGWLGRQKVAKWLKKAKIWLTSTQYCLRVTAGGKTTSTYALDRRTLSNQARHLSTPCYWTLYKTGPMSLPERPVDYGEVISVHQTPEKP